MIFDYLANNMWLSIVVFTMISISDYAWTLAQARLYDAGIKKYIEIEGGIELNPRYREDINKKKAFNPVFARALVLSNVLLILIFVLDKFAENHIAAKLLISCILLAQIFIHTRHIKQYLLYKNLLKNGGVIGKIAYSRKYAHATTEIDAIVFAGLYVVIAIISGQVIFLNGAFMCVVIALYQKKWLEKYQQSSKKE